MDPLVAESLRLLTQNAAFRDLTRHQVLAIGKRGRKRIIPAGTILIDKGDASDRVYLLLDGHARVEREQTGQIPALLAYLAKGDLVGEAALLRGTRHHATVRALDDLLVLELTYSDVQALFRADSAIRLAFLRLVHQRTEELVTDDGVHALNPVHQVAARQ